MAGIALIASVLWAYNFGLEVGLRNQPVFASGEYQEVGCADIVRHEYTLRCEVIIEHEDDNVRIFKGKGALDG